MKPKIIFVFFVIFNGNLINSEFFSSTDELTKLLDNKAEIIGNLKEFICDLEKGSESLKRKLTSLKSEHNSMTQNPQNYIEIPLNAFILIKSLTHDIEAIKLNFRNAFKKILNSAKENQLSTIELDGVVEALIRLKEIYTFKSEDLTSGILDGIKVRDELKLEEISLIADLMKKRGKFKFAEEFYKIAKEKAKNDDEKFEILEKLFTLANVDDDFMKAAQTLSEMQKIKPKEPEELKKLFAKVQQLREKKPEKEFKFEGTYFTAKKSEFIYSQACNGNRLQNISTTSKLFCKFHSTSAFTKISPFKVEILNFEPFVGIYHDVIGESEIQILKNITRGQMSRSGKQPDPVTDIRIAKFKKITDNENEIVAKISSRVGDMTGLRMASGDELKVQNYGVGGFYKIHYDFDFLGKRFQEKGDRIATVMFYLTDVEKGGATIFPFLRLYIPAVKGTAAVWFNLNTSGERDYLSIHASCPVIQGSKWIANKWMREFGEEFTRSCELQRKQSDQNYLQNFYTL